MSRIKLQMKSIFPILISAFFLLIFLFEILTIPACKTDDEDDENSDTIECIVYDFVITPSPSPLIISQGTTEPFEVNAAITIDWLNSTGANCGALGDTYTIEITGTNPHNFSMTGCVGSQFSVNSNSGTCSAALSAPAGVPPGSYEIELSATANLKDERTSVDNYYLKVEVVEAEDFSLGMSNFGVFQGLTATPQVNVTRTGGHNKNIDLYLENVPANITWSFDPNPLLPAETTSMLSVTGDISAVPGEYQILLKGSDGDIERLKNITMFVSEPFTVRFENDEVSLGQGQQGEVNTYIDKVGFWTEPVQMDIASPVIGTGDDKVEALFDPNPVTLGTSELTLIIGSSVEPGTYELEVTASSLGLVKTGLLNLEVTE